MTRSRPWAYRAGRQGSSDPRRKTIGTGILFDREPCVDRGLPVACVAQTASRTCPLVVRSLRLCLRRGVAVLREKVGRGGHGPDTERLEAPGRLIGWSASVAARTEKPAAYRISKPNS